MLHIPCASMYFPNPVFSQEDRDATFLSFSLPPCTSAVEAGLSSLSAWFFFIADYTITTRWISLKLGRMGNAPRNSPLNVAAVLNKGTIQDFLFKGTAGALAEVCVLPSAIPFIEVTSWLCIDGSLGTCAQASRLLNCK